MKSRALLALDVIISLVYLVSCDSLGSKDLSCSTISQLVANYTFELAHVYGGRFSGLLAQCEGISTEGKSAKAQLIVEAKLLGRHYVFPVDRIDKMGRDPWKGTELPVGALYEFKGEATYRLYDTGWKMESFKVNSGRRKGEPNWQAWRGKTGPLT